MTLGRAALALPACLVLSGCFLASENPRFGDSEAVALLGSDTATFAQFDRDGLIWARSELPLVEMVPEGSHYRLHDPSGPDDTEPDPTVHFVNLEADQWLMQVTFPDTGANIRTYYTVARWDFAELLVTAITCDDLEGKPGITDLVAFDGDNCFLLPQEPGASPDFPALLWQGLPPPDKKLVLQP